MLPPFDETHRDEIMIADRRALEEASMLQLHIDELAASLALVTQETRQQDLLEQPEQQHWRQEQGMQELRLRQGLVADLPEQGLSALAVVPRDVLKMLRPGNKTNSTEEDEDCFFHKMAAHMSDDPWMVYCSAAVWALLIFITAFFYKRQKPHPPAQKPGDHVVVDGLWNFHLCSCCEEPSLTCFTCCCAPIRWADNLRMANFCQFWTACILFTILSVLGSVGFGIFNIILICVMVFYRQKLRAMFDIPNNTCKTICSDFCTYCFCALCAIVQEARQLEEAYQMRHPAIDQAFVGQV